MKNTNSLLLTVFAGLLGFTSCAALAQVYKWVDEQGQVHYGARPPAGQSADQVRIQAAPPPDPHLQQRLERSKKQQQSWAEERQEKNEQKAEAAQAAAKREQRCKQARSRLSGLQQSSRIYTTDPDGKRQYYDGAKRQSAIEQARSLVSEYCS